MNAVTELILEDAKHRYKRLTDRRKITETLDRFGGRYEDKPGSVTVIDNSGQRSVRYWFNKDGELIGVTKYDKKTGKGKKYGSEPAHGG